MAFKPNRERARINEAKYRASSKGKASIAKCNASERRAQYIADAKLEALSHYGKDGKLQCCWPDCNITDIDMLNLDHVNDDGAEDRKQCSGAGGMNLCIRLRKQGYPSGYQTLCANHNWKKEIMRRRIAREL